MKVFLDENLPHRLRLAIQGHEVFTASYMGWDGIQNGKLLALVENSDFDVFLTADTKMRGQQNFSGRQIAMVYLTAQEWPMLSSKISEIQRAVDTATTGSFQLVDCGSFTR